MDDVNILAGRLTGDGGIDIIETELPLKLDGITRNLSAPPTLSGSITGEVKRLKKAGRPILEANNSVLLVEADGLLRGGGIYRAARYNDDVWHLDVAGFTSYAQGTPYTDAIYFVDEDPLDIYRHIWEHIQTRPRGNLGITIDPLTSPVRVGKELENVQFTTGMGELVSFEAGPRKLNWYDTHDLGKEVDGYAKETPFDWLETLAWDGDVPRIHVRLGYPQIGGRRDDLPLTLDVNLASVPRMVENEYINEMHVVGAGEGREAVRGFAAVADGRIRRAKTIEDTDMKTKTAANQRAARALAAARGQLIVETLEVHDHRDVPLDGIEVGAEVPLFAETDHGVVDTYVRVIAVKENPHEDDVATLTVVRLDAAAAA